MAGGAGDLGRDLSASDLDPRVAEAGGDPVRVALLGVGRADNADDRLGPEYGAIDCVKESMVFRYSPIPIQLRHL